VAYGDPASDDKSEAYHAVVIGGEEPNHKINIFRQFSGKWSDFLSQLIVFKDNLLVEIFWIPPSSRRVTEGSSGLLKPTEPTGLRDQLFDLDGLTYYKMRGRNKFDQPIYQIIEPKEEWPTFRNWQTKAIVCDYQDRFLVDFEAARLQIDNLRARGEIGGNPQVLAPFEKASHQKPADTLRQPIFRAFVGLCWSMWETSEARRHKIKQEEPDFPAWKEYTNE